MPVILVFVLAALLCGLIDRSSSPLERIGAIACALAMADGALAPRLLPAIVWAVILIAIAVGLGVRIRVLSATSTPSTFALQRALALICMAAVIGVSAQGGQLQRDPVAHVMAMSADQPGAMPVVLLAVAGYAVSAAWSIRTSVSKQREEDGRRGTVGRILEVVVMGAMIVGMGLIETV